jgi:hypothetical protein
MTVAEAIAIGLTAVGLLGSFIGYVIHASSKTGRLEERLQTVIARNTEDREKDRANFEALFAFRNEQNALSREINSKLDNLTAQFNRLLDNQEEKR